MWVSLLALGTSQFLSFSQLIVHGAGQPISVNHQSVLPNGVKTDIRGTISSINDLSNGNVKVKLITQSEADPKELDDILLDGALQFGGNSQLIVEKGNASQNNATSVSFDPQDKGALPQVLFTNVGTTKSGQNVDLGWEVTKYRKPKDESRLTLRVGDQGALHASMRQLGGIESRLTFYHAGTKKPINLMMFPAINDIDYSQAFKLSNATLLGAGSNITAGPNGLMLSDPTPVNGLADFPLGGLLYQYYGSELLTMYNSLHADDVEPASNGYDIFGAFGTIKSIEVAKPDFGEVKIPKASWKYTDKALKANDDVAIELVQPINALDKDINHRYENWETKFTLPEKLNDAKIELVDNNGNVVPTTQKKLSDGRYQVVVTPETMKTLGFKGETYRFKITGKVDGKITDQTTWQFVADTNIDKIKDTIATKTKPIENKATVTVRYLRKDTTEEIAKTQTAKFGYGKPWEIKLGKDVTGYILDAENAAKLSGQIVDFHEKNIDLVYIPREQNLTVNFMLEDGTPLGKTDVPAFYNELYGSSANDIDDIYSLVVEKLPENAAGLLKSENENVNYTYRKTRGYWVELNYGAQAITRMDYRGNIRSNGIDYNDGELITLVNDKDNALIVQHDVERQGGISQQSLTPGQSVDVKLTTGDKVTVSLDDQGTAKIFRDSAYYDMTSEIKQGNWTNTTRIFTGDKKLVEEQITTMNGVSGEIISRTTKQISDGYTVQAEVVTKEQGQPNTKAINVPGTEFKRSVKLSGKPQTALAALAPVSDTEVQELPIENEAADPVFTPEDTVSGAAEMPVNDENKFDENAPQGDLIDDERAMKNLTDQNKVSVFKDGKLLKEGTIPNGQQLTVEELEEPKPEAKNDDKAKDAKPSDTSSKHADTPQVDPNISITPDENGNITTQEPWNPLSKTSGQLPGTGWVSNAWVKAAGVVLLIILILAGFVMLMRRGGKNHV
ncbi:cell surface protein precursor () [Weissella ceti NC36]|nr:cell surface protein precursor () [Weissella ceti NC36]